MQILRAYRTELDPTNKQRSYMGQCCGAIRYVYNWGLAEWKRQYEAGEKPSAYSLRKQFNGIKDDLCPWIRTLPYAVTESAFEALGRAFKNFFRRVKSGAKEKGYPRFKVRGRSRSSFRVRSLGVGHDAVRITGLGWVRLKEQGYLPLAEDIVKYGTYATLSERAGRWFVSVQAYEEMDIETVSSGAVIGIDLGLKSRAVLSNGKVFEIPRWLNIYRRQMGRAGRELSRRKKGGKNWRKSKAKIGQLHLKIANVRAHWLHEISNYVVGLRPHTIVMETLNVQGMMQNRHLARAVADAGFFELRRQIEYKAKWAGIEVVLADTFYPSSKKCSGCGAQKSVLRLSERTYVCESCGLVIDRDLNAATNLAMLGVAA